MSSSRGTCIRSSRGAEFQGTLWSQQKESIKGGKKIKPKQEEIKQHYYARRAKTAAACNKFCSLA
jgi:hypothetical protein